MKSVSFTLFLSLFFKVLSLRAIVKRKNPFKKSIPAVMKSLVTIASFVLLTACNNEAEKQSESGTRAHDGTSTNPETKIETETNKPLPEFAYPVAMAKWSMGDPDNTKTVLRVYKAWEQKDSVVFADAFADSATMDMPDARRLTFTKGKAASRLYQARNQYRSISNDIVSAYALHNEENNADWVMVMVYNKWTYTDGIRDSALFWDNWRLKDGKIVYLNSLLHAPPKTLLKMLETRFE